MKSNPFFVFDTNVLISAALSKKSLTAAAYDHALSIGTIAVSEQLLTELTEVIFREKFDPYFISDEERFEPIRFLEVRASIFTPLEKVVKSPDPKDNMILELAIAANASCIISGDKKHLLSLHPFHGIPILSPTAFLKMF